MKILVAQEKHGNRYFKASTPEELDASCKKILSERLKEKDYWYYNDENFVKRAEEIVNSDMVLNKRGIPRSYQLLTSREGEYEYVELVEVL
jgi:hypothetical protein